MENDTLDLLKSNIAKLKVWNNKHQNLTLVSSPKKMTISRTSAAFILATSTISSPLLATSNDHRPLWSSTTLLNRHLVNVDYSTLTSYLIIPIFDNVSTRNITASDQPNYKKNIFIALIRWVFAESKEAEDKSQSADLHRFASIMVALLNSGSPNKMAVFLAQVHNNITREMHEPRNEALEKLDKAATAKAKIMDKQFEDRQAVMQLARLSQVEASMKQFAALDAKAYQLGFETFNRLKDIDTHLNIPLYERAAFNEGIEIGKHSYDVSPAIRNSMHLDETEKPLTSSDNGLIEADKKTIKNKIELILTDLGT
ncbi:MAG: hypothetical protein ACI8UG_001270 [Gammaproteobacteria bacterium]|jgi:hypothetical protein